MRLNFNHLVSNAIDRNDKFGHTEGSSRLRPQMVWRFSTSPIPKKLVMQLIVWWNTVQSQKLVWLESVFENFRDLMLCVFGMS
jgi:hypothetical protein